MTTSSGDHPAPDLIFDSWHEFYAVRRVLRKSGLTRHPFLEADLCPRCGRVALLYNYDEVDVGVGVIRGNESYYCPLHGEFAHTQSGKTIYMDEEDDDRDQVPQAEELHDLFGCP